MDTSDRPLTNNDANVAIAAPRQKPTGVRWKTGLAVLALGTASIVIGGLTAPDHTLRVIRIMKSVAAAFVVLSVWWLFFSRVPLRWRLGGFLGVVLLAAVGGMASVREIYFDGDMRPRFRFRWEQVPAERTAEWLRQQKISSAATGDTIGRTETVFEITDADWPRYCGANGDRTIREQRPSSFDWTTAPPAELWRHPIGEGWSSCSVVGSRLFTQEQRGPMECVVCYNAETGIEQWRHEDNTRYETAMGGIGPRATPTATGDRLYCLGATGILNCLEPTSGAVIWQTNIVADSGGSDLEWGMSGSPLVDGDLVIVDAGGHSGRAVIAYETASGRQVWAQGSHKAGYAAPRIEVIGDRRQLLIFHGEGLQALDPQTGSPLWEYPWTNQYKINVAQPMRFGDQIFISSGYDAGCVLLDPTSLVDERPREVWRPNKSLKLKFNEAVRAGEFVYGLDDGILACVDARTGERRWKGGRYRFGQVLLWGDVLLIQGEKGTVAIVEATPEEFREVTRFEALSERTWNVPVVCRGRLYVRNANEIACFRL